jgi:hypothetical protein
MSRFAARSVHATLLLSLGVVPVVTPGSAPHSPARPATALSAHVAAAPAGPDRTVPAAVSGSPLAGAIPAGAHLSGPPHGKDGKLR